MKNRRWYWFFSMLFASFFAVTSCASQPETVKNLKAGAGTQIIALGDSITAGYGVAQTEAYPSVLSRQLGIPIVNRGVSGDTTAMALSRLQKDVISAQPWIVIVGIGGNDFLRRIPKTETEQNLRQIVTTIQQQKAIVVLLGMNLSLPELGLARDEYNELVQRVAKDTQAYLIPDVLKGIIDNPQYRQEDIIHPNAAGQKLLAVRVAQGLQPLLADATFPSALLQYRKSNE